MDVWTLQERQGDLEIVDVREPDEWEAGHITGATHVPLDGLVSATDETGQPPFAVDGPVVAVCRTGTRSSEAAARLAVVGIEADSLDGGLEAWVDAGLPLVSADGTPGTVARPDEDRDLHDLLLTLTRDLEAHTGGRPPTEDDARQFLRERLQAQGKSEEEIASILDAQ